MEPNSNVTFVVHSDRLKTVKISSDSLMVTDDTHTNNIPVTQNNSSREQLTRPISHTNNLRPRE